MTKTHFTRRHILLGALLLLVLLVNWGTTPEQGPLAFLNGSSEVQVAIPGSEGKTGKTIYVTGLQTVRAVPGGYVTEPLYDIVEQVALANGTATYRRLTDSVEARRNERLRRLSGNAANEALHSAFSGVNGGLYATIGGMPAEGKIITYKDGKMVWGDLPSFTSNQGTGRRPTPRGSGGDDDDNDGGGSGGGGGGGSPDVNTAGGIPVHDHRSAEGGGILSLEHATVGVLSSDRGGTSFVTYSSGDLLIGKSNGGLQQLAMGMEGQVLTVSGGTVIWENAATGSSLDLSMTDERYLRLSGGTMTGDLIVQAAISGSSLTISSLKGCDSVDTDGQGNLVCGTDSGGGGALSFNDGDVRYVRRGGGSMTGGLIITSGNPAATIDAGLLLEIAGTASGRKIHAHDLLNSSGALAVDGTAYFNSASPIKITDAGFFGCTALETDADGDIVCGTDTDTDTTYTAGRGISLAGTSFALNATITGTLVRFQTVSGSLIYAKNTLASSGTLVFEGAASGSSLYIATSLEGAGLTDCDAANQTLSWDASTKRFSCGTDSDNDTTYTAGAGLTLNGSVFSTNGTLTGSMLRFLTVSGSVLKAKNTLASSGTLVWEGAASGATLYVATSIEGAGLTDCDAAGQTLAWDASTGRFSCGTDADTDTNTTYTAGAGLALNGTTFSTNGTLTGTMLRFLTVSGSVVKAKDTLASSGTLVFEGAASGSSLYIATSLEGAGLVDCDLASQTLAWDASTKRFSCGTDSDTDTTYTAGAGLTLTATSFSTNSTLTGTMLRFLTVSGSLVKAKNTLASSGTLVWEGAASGASLYVATSIEGSGLTDCDAANQTLAWDASTKRFSCGTDADTGTTYTAGAGLTLTATAFSTNSTLTGSMLRFLTVSGSTVYAKNLMAASGSLAVDGTAYLNSASPIKITDAGFFGCTSLETDADGDIVCGADDVGAEGSSYTAGKGLTLNGTVFSTNDTLTGTLLRFLTISGSLVKAKNTLASSGTLVWEGAASGATLYVATSIEGAGLTDCDAASQTLAWDATSKRFSCGTDSDTTYTAGQGLSLNGTIFSTNGTLTGSLLNFLTVSGSVVKAKTTLASSGTLVFEGAASGSSLYIATSLEGAGLVDCDLASQTLAWDASTKRFSCGTDSDTDTTYTAGAGLTLTSTSFSTNATLTGTMLRFLTVSGSVVKAKDTLASSGTLVFEGAASGATLYVASGFEGSGLTDCDAAGQTLAWDASTKRFSCGTDADTGTTYTAGAGLTLTATAFSTNSTLTGSMLRFLTVSGSTVFGKSLVTSSGTITTESGAFFDGTTLVVQSGNNRVGIGTASPDSALEVIGTMSGAAATVSGLKSCDTIDTDANGNLICGTDGGGGATYTAGQGLALNSGVFSVNGTLTGSLLNFLTISGSVVKAKTTLASSGTLVWEGAASGATLYVATSIEGAGLTDCDAAGQKLAWDISTKRFTCGTDTDTNTTYTAGQGLSLNGTVFSTGDSLSGTLLRFLTVSGSLVKAKTTLASSGTLVWEGAASGATLYVATSIEGAGLTDCDAATQTLAWDATSKRFSCGTDSDTTYTAGQGLTLNGTIFSTNGTQTGSMLRFLTVSGSLVYAKTTLASSGTLVWEGAASGATLYVATSIEGAGLTDCDLATQTLAWDSSTKRFSCGTDSDTTYTAGAGLTLTSTSFSTNATLTGTMLRFLTVSGALVKAKTTLASSGTLVWEGAASGASLYVATSIQGSGLTDCDAATSTLAWDTSTGRFSCGSDSDTTYTAGKGLTLTSTSFSTNATLTGTLLRFLTVSGSTVYAKSLVNSTGTISGALVKAKTTLASSGTLVWEGAGSGASLYLGTSLEGAGLTDCDADGQTLAWDATTKRFSCGDDDNSGGSSSASNVTAGQGLSLTSTVLTLNPSISGSLVRFTTVSGSVVKAKTLLTASGVVAVEGNTFFGSGLTLTADQDQVIRLLPGSGSGKKLSILGAHGAIDKQGGDIVIQAGGAHRDEAAVLELSEGPENASIQDVDGSIGSYGWVNPSYAATSDDSHAFSTIESGAASQYLRARDFGFSIPANATIVGIVAEVEAHQSSSAASEGSSSSAGGGVAKDKTVRIVKAGTVSGNNNGTNVTLPDSDDYRTYGSDSDLWGETWTPADINSSTFGVAVSYEATGGQVDAYVDHIRMTIYYTTPYDPPLAGSLTLLAGSGGSPRINIGNSYAHTVSMVGSGGHVGIGTATPGSKLSVSGSVVIDTSGRMGAIAAETGVALEVIGTASGKVMRATEQLVSSGTLMVQGISYMRGDLVFQNDATFAVGGWNNPAAYNFLGTGLVAGPGHTGAGEIENANDLFIEGALEVYSNAFFDGAITMAGTINLNGTLATSATNYLFNKTIGAGGWNNAATYNFFGTGMFAGPSYTSDGQIENANDLFIEGALEIYSTAFFDGNIILGSDSSDSIQPRARFSGSLIPAANVTYDLGSDTLRWRDLYLSGSTIHIGASGDEGTIGFDQGGDYLTLNNGLRVFSNGNVAIGSGAITTSEDMLTLINAEGDSSLAFVTQYEIEGDVVQTSAGPSSPTATNAGGWGDPNNVFAEDGAFAMSVSFGPTPPFYAEDFDFDIPGDAEILGIKVEWKKAADNPATDLESRVLKSGVTAGDNKASGDPWFAFPSFDYETYGGAADLWGTTWTPAEINDPGFGAMIQATSGGAAFLDHVRITVYYEVSGVQTSTSGWFMGSSSTDGSFAITQSGALAESPFMVMSGSGFIGFGTGSDLRARQTIYTDVDYDKAALIIKSDEDNAGQDMFVIISDVEEDDDYAFRIRSDGSVFSDNAYESSGADYAEWFKETGSGQLKPGDTVCIDVLHSNSVEKCTNDADPNVMGIVSTNPAFVGNRINGASGLPVPGYVLVGLIGQLPANAIVESGAVIRSGDQLTPASVPGYVRKAAAGEPTVGVALEPLLGTDGKKGIVNVLVARKNSSLTAEVVSDRVLQTIKDLKIEDELQLSLAKAVEQFSASGTLLEPISDEVKRQISALSLDSIEQRLVLLEQRLANFTGATVIQGEENVINTWVMPRDITGSTLSLEDTLTVASDARVGGDLHVEGSLFVEQMNMRNLFIPGTFTVDGQTTFIGEVATEGVVTINNTLHLAPGAILSAGSGTTIQASDLFVEHALSVLGDITIKGLATFLGNAEVRGELIVSGKQAGYAVLPEGDTSVTVLFQSGFVAQPIVTASPDTPVLFAVSKATSTGFTITISEAVDTDITFSWLALSTKEWTSEPDMTTPEMLTIPEEDPLPFIEEIIPGSGDLLLEDLPGGASGDIMIDGPGGGPDEEPLDTINPEEVPPEQIIPQETIPEEVIPEEVTPEVVPEEAPAQEVPPAAEPAPEPAPEAPAPEPGA